MDGSVKWGLSVLWVALAMRTFVAGGSQVCNITADEMNGLEALFYSTTVSTKRYGRCVVAMADVSSVVSFG
jgi:hypothetical protein